LRTSVFSAFSITTGLLAFWHFLFSPRIFGFRPSLTVTTKTLVKLSPPTNQYPTFYRPDALPVAQPTESKHWRKNIILWTHEKDTTSAQGWYNVLQDISQPKNTKFHGSPGLN